VEANKAPAFAKMQSKKVDAAGRSPPPLGEYRRQDAAPGQGGPRRGLARRLSFAETIYVAGDAHLRLACTRPMNRPSPRRVPSG
jgi:hypothetical protein